MLAAPRKIAGQIRAEIKARGLDAEVVDLGDDGKPDPPVDRIDGAVRSGNMSNAQWESLILSHPSLRWIHTASAGVDMVISPEVIRRGILVTRTRGLHGPPVSEFAMAL